MVRKPTAKSRLATMPQAQQDALVRWLTVDNLSYKRIVVKLREDFGFKCSCTAVCGYFQAHCAALVSERQRVKPAIPATGNPSAMLEILIDVSQPNIVRLQIIPGQGVRVEGGSPA